MIKVLRSLAKYSHMTVSAIDRS